MAIKYSFTIYRKLHDESEEAVIHVETDKVEELDRLFQTALNISEKVDTEIGLRWPS